jgi:hypothetical protein
MFPEKLDFSNFTSASHTLLPVRYGRCGAPLLLKRVGAPIRAPYR